MDKSILLIDDEEGILKVLSISLADIGYKVFTADSGEEGLHIFRDEKPPIVLTDIKMPGMDGIELLRIIKEEIPDTEVIMITGHGEMDLAIESLKLEATDFVTKPINDEILEIALKRAQERITMRRQLREHRENLEDLVKEKTKQLVQAEKIASLGRLAAGVAHEINNPLAGVLIYADILMKEIESNEKWRQDLEEIINQTLRCKQIVARLLEFSRQSLDERVLFDVNEIIGHCVKLLQHQSLFHNIEIIQNLDMDLPQVLGNPGELEQVFTNLMLNASDAMEEKGRITIFSHTNQEEKQVILEFTDTGPGVSPKIREKIFEPFFTTKPLGVGTGLGLSVVYGVVQRHRGSIEVESPPDGGATFTIRLPMEPPDSIPELEDQGFA